MHRMIVGPTGSGKTTLALMMMNRVRVDNPNRKIVVYTPMGEDWGKDIIQFGEWDKFDSFISANVGCECFIDEGSTGVGKYDPDTWWVFTRGRHYGHRATLLTQHPTLISPVVRGQCETFYLFRGGRRFITILEDEIDVDLRESMQKLKRYQFVYAERFGTVGVYEVDKKRKDIKPICPTKR